MNRIIRESCKTLRQLGRQSFQGHWTEAIIFALVCRLILQGPSIIFNFLPSSLQTQMLASLLSFYNFVINGPITLSLTHYMVRMFRQEPHVATESRLSYGFKNFTRAMVLYITMTLITGLLTMLFIIPGLFAALNYSQAFFLLEDNPMKMPMQCMRESKFIMRGNRIKFVSLLFSFAPWYILANVPASVCHIVLDYDSIIALNTAINQGSFMAAVDSVVAVNPLVDVLLLLNVVVSVYIFSARCAFFDILAGKLEIRQYVEPIYEA
ncbi:MAG: DUF975 family protein [Bacillota bacterium]|nr:DUF975 family protein [Bacillota bacterium]